MCFVVSVGINSVGHGGFYLFWFFVVLFVCCMFTCLFRSGVAFVVLFLCWFALSLDCGVVCWFGWFVIVGFGGYVFVCYRVFCLVVVVVVDCWLVVCCRLIAG